MIFKKPLVLFTIFTAVVLFVTFTLITFKNEMQRYKLPELGSIGQFTLIEKNGGVFDSKILDGRVWVVDFFFTTCSDVCPMMMKRMADLSRTFELVKGVHFVSITVNPENDTPEILNQYSSKLQTNNKNWHFLTGSREDISAIMRDHFKLGDKQEPVFHSTFFALVDRNGYIRGYYDGMDKQKVEKLFKDIALLLKER